MGVKRITVEEAYKKISSGEALFVCAYEEEAKYETFKLQFSIPIQEFRSMRKNLHKDREIIFYCA